MSAGQVNGASVDERTPTTPAFDQLEAQALALEAEAAPPATPGAPGQAEPVDNAAELLGALQLARMMVAPMFAWWPDFERTYSDATLERIAAGGGAVMDKHGWTTGGLMGEWGPYIALATATAPPLFATWQAVKSERARRDRPPAPVVRTGPTDPPNQ